MLTLCRLFLWLLFYSFAGWVYESILCSITERKWVNRGFLYGPLCPIYGSGAVLILLTLGRLSNPVVLFLAGMALCSILEYAVSLLLEGLFHARWWDYSHMRFQLGGRICLLGALVFGGFAVALVLWIHPAVYLVTVKIPDRWIFFSSAALLLAVTADTAVTVSRMLRMNSKLQEIQSALNGFFEESRGKARELRNTVAGASLERVHAIRANLLESFENSRFYSERIHTLLQKHTFQERRFFRSFPRMRSIRYAEAFQKLREAANRHLPPRDGK